MELERIAEGIYFSQPEHEIDQPCLYAVVGRDRTLMIDGGVSPEKACQFTCALGRETGRSIDFVAVTHWHWDHTFGLAGVDAPMIACAGTAARLKRLAGYPSWSDEALDERVRSGEEITFCADNVKKVYPGALRSRIVIRQPDVVFGGTLSIDLGGLTCNLEQLPPVHTDDSVAIHVPERGVLFIGDSTGPNFYDHPAHYSAPAVLELMEFIRGKGAAVIAESHAGPETPVEFWAVNGILETAARGVRSGIRSVPALMGHLHMELGPILPGDAEEIAELFVSGIGS